VHAEIVERLLSLNRLFYQTFALQFSATRQRLQPGVQRLLAGLPPGGRLLDLGCGNGELARHLRRRLYRGTYVGLDNSPGLLEEAQRQEPSPAAQNGAEQSSPPFRAAFLQADLAGPGWERVLASLPLARPEFDAVFAFAVLHHLPGDELRLRTLVKVRDLLVPGGRFIHSNWQFLDSARLRARIEPWERVGLSPAQVDPGDYLLDWRAGGLGLRYVHHFGEAELAALAGESGFRVEETFYSDGEGGRLGLYQVWSRE
jgi:SAM-dependent methyltransferase